MLESFEVLLADATPTMLDALATLLEYGIALNDMLVFQEQVRLLYGMATTGDTIVMTDAIAENLISVVSLSLADSDVANWLDAVLLEFIFAPGAMTCFTIQAMGQIVAQKISSQGQMGAANVAVAAVQELQVESIEVIV